MKKAERVLEASAELGEGALWDERASLLLWVDIMGRKLHRFDPATGRDEFRELPSYIGTVVPGESGDLHLALKDGFYSYGWADSRLLPLAVLGLEAPYIRFNDGKCDPQGRFWAGTMAMGGRQGAGNLFCLERDLTVSRKIKSVSISNGLGWSPDGSRMYYIDTPTRRVLEFAFDGAKGSIQSPRVALDVPEPMGWPDGLCVDAEGMLWIAMFGGGRCVRFDPGTGKALDEVKVEGALQTTSCALGGVQGRTLYVTTARENFTDKDAAEQPQAGHLFAAEVGVPGLPCHRFRPLTP